MSDYKCKKDLNLTVESGQLMLHFARYVWPRQNERTPSGKTWSQVFESAHNISLSKFKTLMEEDS